jgi:hypothetical protein
MHTKIIPVIFDRIPVLGFALGFLTLLL